MATEPATMAATARAAEARDAWVARCQPVEPEPLLSGRRAALAALVVLVAAALVGGPALVAAGLVVDASALGRAAAWLERLPLAAPAILTARAVVAVVAVVAIARSDGQG